MRRSANAVTQVWHCLLCARVSNAIFLHAWREVIFAYAQVEERYSHEFRYSLLWVAVDDARKMHFHAGVTKIALSLRLVFVRATLKDWNSPLDLSTTLYFKMKL